MTEDLPEDDGERAALFDRFLATLTMEREHVLWCRCISVHHQSYASLVDDPRFEICRQRIAQIALRVRRKFRRFRCAEQGVDPPTGW